MGEIADAYLNGDFDEETGEWLGNGACVPRSPSRDARSPKPAPKPHVCPECGKAFRIKFALADHRRDKHAIAKEAPHA